MIISNTENCCEEWGRVNAVTKFDHVGLYNRPTRRIGKSSKIGDKKTQEYY